MNALVPRATITQIAGYRDRALELYSEAHRRIESANDAMKEAAAMLRLAAPMGNVNALSNEAREKFFSVFETPPRDEFMSLARHMIDADVWSHVIKVTDLERLMDKKAKDELRRQMVTDPPEFTAGTAFATMQTFAGQADMIFMRGIAEVFSNLDRRFKSHDGFKIGSRVIINHAFDEYGHWNYHRSHRDTLQDIERVFLVLDGKKPKDQYAGIVGAVDTARAEKKRSGRMQCELEADYYRVRMFMNGNVHLWFTRKDLVEKVNKLLADYYGEVIPDGMTPEDDGGLHEPKRAMAKNYGFFPTPDSAADKAIEAANLWRPEGEPRYTVLEPSAGTGNLSKRAVRAGGVVSVVEVQPGLSAELRSSGLYKAVYGTDFLSLSPAATGLFDRVIMSPPFDRERDIDHVMHAMKFLKPDGFLVAIMSAGTEFRETRKSIAFRKHIESLNGKFQDLPAGSFSSVGTNVNTVILRVYKDGKTFY